MAMNTSRCAIVIYSHGWRINTTTASPLEKAVQAIRSNLASIAFTDYWLRKSVQENTVILFTQDLSQHGLGQLLTMLSPKNQMTSSWLRQTVSIANLPSHYQLVTG